MTGIFLYNKALVPIGPLERALSLSYELKENEMNTAAICLAQGDAQNAQIVPGETFARIDDGGRDIGFFRFCDIPRDERRRKGQVEYSLKSAECTLLDDLLEGWHELGGTGVKTREVLLYLLEHQTVKRWVLGECEFEDEFQYNFEDVTLLEAIASLGEVIVGGYAMRFDTTATPWTLHFTRAAQESAGSLVYGRNVQGIERSVDATVVTRLFGRGYGEGDNQLTIAGVNGGLDYLDAPGVSDPYDVREGVYADRRQTDPAMLKARMEVILEMGCRPRVSYEVDAIDYYQATGEAVDDIRTGDTVRVLDEISGEVTALRVVSETHSDAIGDPGRVKYVLSTGRADSAEALNEVIEKIGVQELYSQGATNMYSMQLSDNADGEHPLEMRFYVPGNVLRINSCLIYWQLERFRTYATMAAAGGASARTSSSGGGMTVSTPESVISDAAATGGPLSGGEGVSSVYTESAGDHSHVVNRHRHGLPMHSHNLNAHTHSISTGASSTGTPSPVMTVGNTAGNTEYYAPGTDEVDAHTHRFSHWHHATVTVTIPPMEFELEAHTHTLNIPDHTHELEYGVYEGERADEITLVVDGEEVPAEAIGEASELDVAPYLRKDADGRVTRGTWHTVAFTPDKLTRITEDLFFQVFIQSRGAGDY